MIISLLGFLLFVLKLTFTILICLIFFKLTTRFLMQVLDSAGEFGWQLERAGLSGDGLGVPMRGDSGSPFISFDPGWQVRKAPGLREPPTSAGTLQEKQRKCRNYLNLSTRRKHTNHSSCTG